MSDYDATFTSLSLTASWTSRLSVTGAGGLMEFLGMPDSRAVDGKGQAFALHPVLGVVAIGFDGIEGTDDDM